MKKKKTERAQGKRRGFNAADVAVLLVIALCVAVAVWVFGDSGIFGAKETVTIEYEIYIIDVRNDIASHIQPGCDVIEATRHYNIGVLSDHITTTPYKFEKYVDQLYDENGNLLEDPTGAGERVEVEKPGYVSLYLPVTAKATVESDGYYVNGYKVNVGTHIYIRTPDFAGGGYVTSLTVIDGGEQ